MLKLVAECISVLVIASQICIDHKLEPSLLQNLGIVNYKIGMALTLHTCLALFAHCSLTLTLFNLSYGEERSVTLHCSSIVSVFVNRSMLNCKLLMLRHLWLRKHTELQSQ